MNTFTHYITLEILIMTAGVKTKGELKVLILPFWPDYMVFHCSGSMEVVIKACVEQQFYQEGGKKCCY